MRTLIQSLRWFIAVLTLCGFWAVGTAHAQSGPDSAARAGDNQVPKWALVIGNGSYRDNKSNLKNAVNDARLMSQTLHKLGFKVQHRENLDRSGMQGALKDFASSIPPGATSFVFYAGHGLQAGGSSYLIPTDMELTSEQRLPFRAIALKSVLESVSSAKSAVNIVVLDACRDNPFQPVSPIKYRSFSNLGLAPVQAPRGTLVAYSTAPNQRAPDGRGDHSIYASTLVEVLQEPGLSLINAFSILGERVRRQTLDNQIPWFETSLVEEYFLLPPPGVKVVAGRAPQAVAGANALSQKERQRALVAPTPHWYRDLSEKDWSQLDWEIGQRVAALTPDEIPQLEHQAKGGSVVAQTTLGIVWREGINRARTDGKAVTRFNANNTKAVTWLRQAAKAGFPIAQIELAEMMYRGRGLPKDTAQARQLASSAARANYPRAKLDLVQMDAEEGSFNARTATEAFESANRAYLAATKQKGTGD